MGLLELPSYTSHLVDNNPTREVRPDLQAKSRMGQSQSALGETIGNGILGIAEGLMKAAKRRNVADGEQAKLDIEKTRRGLATRLEKQPINESSPEWAELSDFERLAPNKAYLDKKVREYSDKRLTLIKDKTIRGEVDRWNQERQISAGDALYTWDIQQSNIKSGMDLKENVSQYVNIDDIAGAEARIDRGQADGILGQEQALNWKNSIRKDVFAKNSVTEANKFSSSQDGVAYLQKNASKYLDAYGKPQVFTKEEVGTMVAAYNEGLSTSGKQAVDNLKKQFEQQPEATIPNPRGLITQYQNMSISDSAKKDVTALIQKHNDDAIYSQFSDRISSTSDPDDLKTIIFDLQNTGAQWLAPDQETRRWELENRARSLLKAADDDDKDKFKTAKYANRMLSIYEGVQRKDNPSPEDRRGARLAIISESASAALEGINMTSDARGYLVGLGALTNTDNASLKAYDALYMKANRITKESDLSATQISEKNNLMDTMTRMREQGTKTEEEINQYIQGALLDMTQKTFQVLREDKLGQSLLTTGTMPAAIDLLQSGKLKYQSPVVQGRTMVNPTIDASIAKVGEYMAQKIGEQGFTDVTPQQLPDGSFQYKARRPGMSQPYTLKPRVDSVDKNKLVIDEYITSKKDWKPWVDLKTKAPASVEIQPKTLRNPDYDEIQKIMTSVGSDPNTVVNQLVNAVVRGRINYNAILTSGIVPTEYFVLVEQEYKDKMGP